MIVINGCMGIRTDDRMQTTCIDRIMAQNTNNVSRMK